VYDVKFNKITSDNTPLRKSIIRCLGKELEKIFKLYLFTGTVLYSPTNIGTAPINCPYDIGVQKSKVDFLFPCNHLQDILHPNNDPAKAQTAVLF